MENTTEGLNTTLDYDVTRFIVLETAFSILSLILIYIITCLLWYERSIYGQTRPRVQSLNSKTGNYALAMRVQSILGPVFLLARLGTDHYELVTQYLFSRSTDFCSVTWIIKIAFSALCMGMIYMFLWTRQSLVYADSSIRHLTNPLTKVVSWLVLFLLFVAQIVCTILFGVTRQYKLEAQGCQLSYSSIPQEIPWIVLAASTVGFQVLLTGLFLYPIINRQSASTRSRGFVTLVKRTTITAGTCMISDIVASLLILLVNDEHNILGDLVFALNLMINIISVLAAFLDWRVRVFPMCQQKAAEDKPLELSQGPSYCRSTKSVNLRALANGKTHQVIKTVSSEAFETNSQL